MSTPEKVDEFYTKNYNRLINYIKNGKKGGDKVGVITDDAVDILHDTYCYHKANPQHFDGRYIWNVLKQRRLNYKKSQDNYNSLKDDFYQNFYSSVDWDKGDGDPLPMLIDGETKGLIKQEIGLLRNEKHKAILKSHILEGEVVSKSMVNEQKVVSRFRKKMVDKYGEEDG